jgi:hypothetical protein
MADKWEGNIRYRLRITRIDMNLQKLPWRLKWGIIIDALNAKAEYFFERKAERLRKRYRIR